MHKHQGRRIIEPKRRSLKTPMFIQELLDDLHVFRDALKFEPAHYGWVKQK